MYVVGTFQKNYFICLLIYFYCYTFLKINLLTRFKTISWIFISLYCKINHLKIIKVEPSILMWHWGMENCVLCAQKIKLKVCICMLGKLHYVSIFSLFSTYMWHLVLCIPTLFTIYIISVTSPFSNLWRNSNI